MPIWHAVDGYHRAGGPRRNSRQHQNSHAHSYHRFHDSVILLPQLFHSDVQLATVASWRWPHLDSAPRRGVPLFSIRYRAARINTPVAGSISRPRFGVEVRRTTAQNVKVPRFPPSAGQAVPLPCWLRFVSPRRDPPDSAPPPGFTPGTLDPIRKTTRLPRLPGAQPPIPPRHDPIPCFLPENLFPTRFLPSCASPWRPVKPVVQVF